VCIADAVQCSSFNALAGWHSDDRWSVLIIAARTPMAATFA